MEDFKLKPSPSHGARVSAAVFDFAGRCQEGQGVLAEVT